MNEKIISKVKRVSELGDKNNPEQLYKAVYPGLPCAFRSASTYTPKIKDSHTILCGPNVCLFNAKMHDDVKKFSRYMFEERTSYVEIDQEDLIMGYGDKVKEAILEVNDRYEPKVIFLVTTCLGEITGEDVEAVVYEIEREIDTKILFIPTNNFCTDDCAPGIENAMLVLEKLMEKREVKEKKVNFIGAMACNPLDTELGRLISERQIELSNIFPSSAGPEKIAQASEAKLNIVLSHYGLPLARRMKERFEIDYVYIEKAYMPDSIESDYLRIGECLNIDFKDEVSRLKSETQVLLDGYKNRYAGKSCVLSIMYGMQLSRMFELAFLLDYLGFEVKAIFTNKILEPDKVDMEKLLEHSINPYVLKYGDFMAMEDILAQLQPDFFFGDFENSRLLVEQGIEVKNLNQGNKYLGFETIEKLMKIIDGPKIRYEALRYREELLRGEEKIHDR